MPPLAETGSRTMLRRLRQALAKPGEPQERLDRIVEVIAVNMVAEVCSIYLRRDDETLEPAPRKGCAAKLFTAPE